MQSKQNIMLFDSTAPNLSSNAAGHYLMPTRCHKTLTKRSADPYGQLPRSQDHKQIPRSQTQTYITDRSLDPQITNINKHHKQTPRSLDHKHSSRSLALAYQGRPARPERWACGIRCLAGMLGVVMVMTGAAIEKSVRQEERERAGATAR